MAPPRRYWVRLKLPQSFLSTLPEFPTPISKSRLKKIAAEERKAGSTSISASGSKVGSPAPTGNESTPTTNLNNPNNNPAVISNFKINSGLKESSTSGLTMNSISQGLYALDKSGKPSKKWIKKPRQFKTFSGFKVKHVSWEHKDELKHDKKTVIEAIVEDGSASPIVSASATPDIRSEA
ncbi:INO80 complex subunit Ies4-domain-containing protein [Scheffersomyces coipomensis]|uniref:INO80 complex subunit Ies4-domain-containing protein n=1 Tax=Scheffersomyces coipomensis TaxID=1788519 RepID=UPI00315D1901